MKIKDIIVREDDGTGALTTKPLPGAQQIIAPDGKPIGTADQATADAMKAAAEKGTLTLGGDEQQTSEEQGDSHHTDLHIARKLFHANPDLDDEQEILNAAFPFVVELMNGSKKRANHLLNYNEDFPAELIGAYKWLQRHQHSVYESHSDLVDQGNDDVGGDGTDQFIHDIKMYDSDVDEEISSDDVAQAQAGFGGADPTSKQGIDNFLAQDDSVTPEEKEKIKSMMSWEPDGTLDVHGTLQTVSKQMPQVFQDLCQMMDDMADAFEKAKNDPGMKDLPPEQIKQIDDTIAACRKAAADSRAQLPALNKSVSDIQALPKSSMRETEKRADDELLEKMRMIAGLR
jgi:hypothetical protein